tara:strand:+ start:24278 stop:25741 length:1464 start_codon:yes stop_codon:yes gene_type:complete
MNPELRRYLWTEFSLGRVIFMPVILGLVLLLFGVWTFDSTEPGGGEEFLESFVATGTIGYILVVLFWGSRIAAAAMVREIADKTWDQQRLSSMGAWGMTWGKLFGSTSYVWYGCGLLLAVALISLGLIEAHYGAVSEEMGRDVGTVMLQLVLGLAALTVLIESCVMLIAMTAVSRRNSARQLDVTIAQAVVIITSLVLFSMMNDMQDDTQVVWFGHLIDATWFAVGSTIMFAAWAVVGLWRRMRLELQMPNRPLMWSVFVLFAGAWLAGLAVGPGKDDAVTLTAVIMTITAMVLTYVPAVLERMDPVNLRRLVASVRGGRVGSILSDAPVWVINHGLALLGLVLSVILLLSQQPSQADQTADLFSELDMTGFAPGTLVAAWLFITRDLMLLVFAWLGRNTRRAFTTWLIWMVVLYALAPMIVAALGAHAVLPAFVPAWDVPFVHLGISPLVWPALEIVVVAGLVRWRWRRFAASAVETKAEAVKNPQ